MYYLMKNKLPESAYYGVAQGTRSLVRTWILGEKYQLPEFQDLVMLELLEHLDCWEYSMAVVREAFEGTPVGSPLRKLMAEEAVEMVRWGLVDKEELDVCDGVVGFTRAFAEAYEAYMDNGDVVFRYLKYHKWHELMVAGGPEKHWVFDR